jgi:hypothetical protein
MDLIVKSGGLSYSNTYDIEWVFPEGSLLAANLSKVGIQTTGGDKGGTLANYRGDVVKLFCDEAQLPNVSASTGQTTGKFLGEGQVNYPHTRIFTDFSLGWICDADMTPLKFLNVWYNTIFNEYIADDEKIVPIDSLSNNSLSQVKNEASSSTDKISPDRSVRLSYPSQYQATCIITKAEKGKNASNSRASISYTMLQCFPYSIDAIPMSAGTSQATKVTANFYYSKHSITYNNISSYRG